jgi:hypothetical protein
MMVDDGSRRTRRRHWDPAAKQRGGTPPSPELAQDSETGAILILALIFLLVGVLVVSALSYSAANDLNNSKVFKVSRQLQYAASSVTNLAIQNIRYTPLLLPTQTLSASPPSYCWGSSGPSQLAVNGFTMDVWCSTAWNPTSASTRIVTLSTCQDSSSLDAQGNAAAATACAASPLLQATVTFDDYPSGQVFPPTAAQCDTYCGSSMAIDSWVWRPVVPSVTSLSATTGPVTGGTSLTITGSGFVQNGTSVSFIKENYGVPTYDNVISVVSPANVTVNSSTSLTLSTPSVTSGTTFFVVVTTPSGKSAFSSQTLFIYSAVVPSVTSITPTQGGTPGGTAITINGAGFSSGSIVTFVPTGGGTSLQASNITVVSGTQITAVSPGVTSPSSYYVEVTTSAGTSSAGPTFTYQALVPTVLSISPNTGGYVGGKSVTLTGSGFVAGDSVCFVLASTASPGATTCSNSATITSLTASTITATTPRISISATGIYYAYVLDSSGNSSSLYPTFTYTTSTTP